MYETTLEGYAVYSRLFSQWTKKKVFSFLTYNERKLNIGMSLRCPELNNVFVHGS